MLRDEIVRCTDDLLKQGVRFRIYGRNPKYGFDCLGVILYVGTTTGAMEPLKTPPYSFPPPEDNFEIFHRLCKPGTWQRGTIIVLTNEQGLPHHMAILNHQKADGEWKAIGIRPDAPPRFAMFTINEHLKKHLWGLFDYPNL